MRELGRLTDMIEQLERSEKRGIRLNDNDIKPKYRRL